MRIILRLATAAVLVTMSTASFAVGDPIQARQSIMKNVGAAMKAAGAMATGKMEYDALATELAVRTINSSAIGFPMFFPEDSKTGGETEAAPTIWEDMDGFSEGAAQLATDAATATEAAKGGMDAFKGAFFAMAKNCKACHEKFRVKKN
jgi:cytochrome c556